MKKQLLQKKRYPKYGVIAASVVFCAMVLSADFAQDIYAQMYVVAKDIASYLGIEKNLDTYKTVVDQSVTDKGITVTLKEVLLNNDELFVSTIEHSDEPLENNALFLSGDIFINGKSVFQSSGGSSTPIDSQTNQSLLSYSLPEIDLEGDLDIKLNYTSAFINGKEIHGKWVFEFTTNGDEIQVDTIEIPLEYHFSLPDKSGVVLQKYTSNAMGQKIYFTKEGMTDTRYDMRLEGTDDLGNPVEFYLSRATKTEGVFLLETITNGNLNEKAATLTLTPYAVAFPEESGRLSNDFEPVGEEFTVSIQSFIE